MTDASARTHQTRCAAIGWLTIGCLLGASLMATDALAQTPQPDPADVASPEAIVLATYGSIIRAPGEPYDWDRFRSLFLPEARLIPNVQQTGGTLTVLTPEDFVQWIGGNTVIGGPNDRGFAEEEVSSVVQRFGNMAQVFSTYAKRFGDDDQVLGMGINSFQLIQNGGRWWIAGIVWDEERPGLVIPPELRGG